MAGRTYKCVRACTFGGRYYGEGDKLTTDAQVPEYFKAAADDAAKKKAEEEAAKKAADDAAKKNK